jgi:hypothetical protein
MLERLLNRKINEHLWREEYGSVGTLLSKWGAIY